MTNLAVKFKHGTHITSRHIRPIAFAVVDHGRVLDVDDAKEMQENATRVDGLAIYADGSGILYDGDRGVLKEGIVVDHVYDKEDMVAAYNDLCITR